MALSKLLASLALCGKLGQSQTLLNSLAVQSHHRDLSSSMGIESDQDSHQSRDLQMLYYTERSLQCKSCIDKNYYFCQNAAGSAGQCCESSLSCNEVDICSYHAPIDSQSLKYWACPHSLETCGVENLFVPQKNGAASTIKPKGDYQTNFNLSAMCRYRLIFP